MFFQNRYVEGTPARAQTVRTQPSGAMAPPPRASPSVRTYRDPAPLPSRHVGNGAAVRQPSTEEYFPIWETGSETGDAAGHGTSPLDKVPPAPSRVTGRRDSVDSIPEMAPPPPPDKQGSKDSDMMVQGELDPEATYDHPSKSYPGSAGGGAQYVNMDVTDSPVHVGPSELYQVPPPRAHQRVTDQDDGLYKVPPTRYTQYQNHGVRGANATSSVAGVMEDWYQVPPPAKHAPVRQSQDMFYDVPPSRPEQVPHARPTREPSQRNSNSSNESKSSQKGGGSDSAYGSEDLYDHPPAHRAPDPPVAQVTRQLRTTELRTTTAAASVISTAGDVYDVPPPRKNHSEDNLMDRVPPPPKPKSSPPMSPDEQGPYLNLPPNSKAYPQPVRQTAAPPKRTTVTMDDMYDFPTSLGSKDKAMLSLSPPPPPAHACSVASTQHGYVNAPPGIMPAASPPSSSHVDSVYMPMDLVSTQVPAPAPDPMEELYLPMGQRGAAGRGSSGSAIYTDMSGGGGRSYSAAPGSHPPRLQRLNAAGE